MFEAGAMRNVMTGLMLLLAPLAHSAGISPIVAQAYNDGVVRCGNAECAKYLYACFRSYSGATLQEFLTCGSLASRLNNGQRVVSSPTPELAQK